MKLPIIQFSVGDWRKDLGIQSLSYHHRGVWFEILMLMHCSEQRGRLVLGGKPMPDSALARLLGLSEQELNNTVSVLIAQGVANRDQNGALVNRRMLREEDLKQKRRQSGSIGGSKSGSKREATPFDKVNFAIPFAINKEKEKESSKEREREIHVHTAHAGAHEPSVDELKALAKQRVVDFANTEGIRLDDAEWFFYKCEGNGWTNRGQPILDWKATLRSWKRGRFLPSQRRTTEFVRPKEKAPSYDQLPEQRTPSDEELATARRIAKEEIEKLRIKLSG